MYVFNEIAARYGANPEDENSVQDFFENKLPALNPEEQQEIFDELLARDGETQAPSSPPSRTL